LSTQRWLNDRQVSRLHRSGGRHLLRRAIAFDHDRPIFQALAIALLAFMAKDLLVVEPEIYLINGKDGEDE
jgi:hypothetical protein